MAQAIEILINEAMKLERNEVLGAGPYERTEARRGYANGFKDKNVRSRLGELNLRVPEEFKILFRSHPVLFASSDGMDFRTGVSVIWDIPKQTAYIAPDRPDLVEYERVTWSDE